MLVTKSGRCSVCKNPTREQKEFPDQADMFDANRNWLRGENREELRKWKDQDLLCEKHRMPEVYDPATDKEKDERFS